MDFFCEESKRDYFSSKCDFAITFITVQIHCKYKESKIIFLMKVNMTKSDANIKFSIIFAAL